MAVWWVLLGLGTAWTLVWGWVLLHAGPGPSYEAAAPVVHRVRRVLFVGFLVAFATLFAASIHAYPYIEFRRHSVGAPAVAVDVRANQWSWALSRTQVPAGVPVEFDVTSEDVNHGFGVYTPDGLLVTQVQAMPGYTNRLVYRFTRPGSYTNSLPRVLRDIPSRHVGHARSALIRRWSTTISR